MRVRHLIVGAGMAGLVLRRFLEDERSVLIDARPGAYKIGESVVPEQFEHPVMRALLPRVRELPSYTAKHGTTFVSGDSVAAFPLPPADAKLAMHVARAELEQLMAREWNSPIRTEKIESIDLARKIVRTDREVYEVEGQIIDCSGPAMVVASAIGDVSALWPVSATWSYFDVVEQEPAAFFRWLDETGRRMLRYDAPRRRLLTAPNEGWSPGHTTILSQLRDGVWTWQIPLFDGRLLSFGVVSRSGAISADEYYEIAREHHAPNFHLARRPPDASSPYSRLHERSGFARRASVASTRDYILLADAFAFADPVYSVGTALAVNKAIQLAMLLNEGPWTDERSAAWCAESERLVERAIRAFEFWYSGAVMRDDAVAAEVRDEMLVGNAFQVTATQHYGTLLADVALHNRHTADGHEPRHGDHGREVGPLIAARPGEPARGPRVPLDEPVARLPGVDAARAFAGWRLTAAERQPGGLALRWVRDGKPELLVFAVPDDGAPCFLRAGPLNLSYLSTDERPYPFDPSVRTLLDALARSIADRVDEWLALGAVAPTA